MAVVVPTLDEAEHIAPQLERLLRSPDTDDRADEVIVCDGGSSDETVSIARLGGARVVVSGRGRGEQLRAGARLARAELLVFLHADNRLVQGALSTLRQRLGERTFEAAALRQRIVARGWFFRAVERAADRRVRRGLVYGDSTLCVRRELYERAGGFAALPLFEDLEFSRRLRRMCRIELVEEAVVEVDARRWRREGWLWTTLRNWTLRAAYELGAAPARLSRWYPAPKSGARRSAH